MFKKAPIFLWIIMLSLAFVAISCNKHDDDDDDWGNGNGNGGGGGIWNPTIIDGKLPGLFSVSPTQQVLFSQGNLQYQASTNTWRFAEYQWDYVGSQKPSFAGEIDGVPVYYDKIGGTVSGSDNSEISPTYSGWIDLFGWGTSGWDCGNTYYHPWDTAICNQYGPSGNNDLTGSYAHSDWGLHNAISNGGNQQNYWRTLTLDEWEYLFETRTTSSGIRFAKAKVNEVGGIILLPDDWDSSTYSLNNPNNATAESYFSDNTITATQWTTLENAGVVFLPAAGSRYGVLVVPLGPLKGNYDFSLPCCGYYWSASSTGNEAGGMFFLEGGLHKRNLRQFSCGPRYYGLSVRLVHSTQNSNNSFIEVTTNNVTDITQTTAVCGGNVTVTGNATVTACGVCWSTSPNPTIDDNHTNNGTSIGSFTSSITGLTPNTTYYVRAFATNSKGTSYGVQKSFTTTAIEPIDYASDYVGNYLGQFILTITSMNNNPTSSISFPIDDIRMNIIKGTTTNTLTAIVTINDESYQTSGVATEEKAVFEPFHSVIDRPEQDCLFNLDFIMEGTKTGSNILTIAGTFSGNGSAIIMGYEQFFNEISGPLSGELMKQ